MMDERRICKSDFNDKWMFDMILDKRSGYIDLLYRIYVILGMLFYLEILSVDLT